MRHKVNVRQPIFLGDGDVASVRNEVHGFGRAEFCRKRRYSSQSSPGDKETLRICTFNRHREIQRQLLYATRVMLQENKTVIKVWV